MIHHVQLACPAGSEGRLRQFFVGVLGFDEIADFRGMRRFYSADPNGDRLEFLEPL